MLWAAAVFFLSQMPVYANPLLVDDFKNDGVINHLGNRANIFLRAPSRVMVTSKEEMIEGILRHVLLIRYDKKNSGGPFDSGGWCGYYTLLKSPENVYLDVSVFKTVTFWVSGGKGAENIVVGLADRYWDKVGDSAKSLEIGRYLLHGKLTREWQKVRIPFSEFFMDYTQLAAIAIIFDSDLFSKTGHAGTIYIADLSFE